MVRKHWYKVVFILLILLPAALCQTVRPFVSYQTWEMWSEALYGHLLRYQTPDDATPSQVAVIEVDQRTLDLYGWPIDRSHYVTLLNRLKKLGHPWILSLFQFQSLEKIEGSTISPAVRRTKDKALAAAIGSYDRYVGTGLEIRPGSELDLDQEEELLPRVVLNNRDTIPTEFPYLPLTMIEDDSFVKAQKAFGFGVRLGPESVIRCMPVMLTDAENKGEFVIPSSLIWTAALTSKARIVTSSGASWPRKNERQPFAFSKNLSISYKHCLTSPSMTTRAFLEARDIKIYSMADVLRQAVTPDFTGKAIILARDDMRRFRATGDATETDNGIVEEHLLAARFLDNLITGRTIQRDWIKTIKLLDSLPLIGALFMLMISLRGSLLISIGAGAILLAGVLVYSAAQLQAGRFEIPIQVIASLTLTSAGLTALLGYLKYYGIRRQIRFSQRMRLSFSQVNNLDALEQSAGAVCREEFERATLEFADYDEMIYRAAGDPKAALALMETKRDSDVRHFQFGGRSETVLSKFHRPEARSSFLGGRSLNVLLAATATSGRLGTIKLILSYHAHEEGFITAMLEALRIEICQHWNRIRLLADQKLLDYRYLMEQTRGDIMERFLTQVLVARFSDKKSMSENLQSVLTPRPTKAALFQADIRGYSKVSATLHPLEMVRLLQSYYRDVVDTAQTIAQVKLIGDCIFLFIEEDVGTGDVSPADLALDIAVTLAQGTEKQNRKRRDEGLTELNFGIAVHYGDVVAGNLSSDSCIDYTVIGPNVNMVARLEELTKNPEINDVAGSNGIIISKEAAEALIKHKTVARKKIDLKEMNLCVRSFSHVEEVYAIRALTCLQIAGSERLENAS